MDFFFNPPSKVSDSGTLINIVELTVPDKSGKLQTSITNRTDQVKRVKSTKDEILKAFRLFDDDETGKISFKNLKRVAKELGERMTDEELQEMIDEADRDGDGEVNEKECLRIMKKTNIIIQCLF